MRPDLALLSAALLAAALLAACGPPNENSGGLPDAASAAPAASASASSMPALAASARVAPAALTRREGQTLVRSPSEAALYLADEDHAALRRIALTPELATPPPIATPAKVHRGDAAEARVELPGRPAQVFATADRVLVTIRDPGMLMAFSTGEAPKELGRIALPADAWGLAVSADAAFAYVTSAWTHQLSKIDLAAMRALWSVDVAREPRGVTVSADGKKVYVSHLIGAEITRVDVTGEPVVTRVSLPPDPLRTFAGDKSVTASLGYAAILAPDGRRLFVGRHALGALWSWQGNTSVDVLSTLNDEPVAAARGGKPLGHLTAEELKSNPSWADHAGVFVTNTGSFVQPRAIAYRAKTHHLLVASEGSARVAELDAMSTAPGLVINRYYRLGGSSAPIGPTKIQISTDCGAPSGIALSADEDVAWVHCRTSDNVVAVRLTPDGERAISDSTVAAGPFAYVQLSVPPLPEALALGRRLFFDAEESVVSGEMACAGCHPDGRDDGHVWREFHLKYYPSPNFRAGPTLALAANNGGEREPYGVARQTPMLAGRVNPVGPYGWHGESPTLIDRIKAGFGLHRSGSHSTDGATSRARAEPIAEFLRKGLVPPPREAREPTDQERKGKEIFNSPKTQCATCHVPGTDFTDRSSVQLGGFKTLRLFDEDPKKEYKVPSLLFVGGTPPYYHDGSEASLDALVDHIHNRMGRTTHLSAEERAALVAYLRTL